MKEWDYDTDADWWIGQTQVVCIDNSGFGLSLTVNRVYNIVEGEINFFSPIKVKNDIDEIYHYDERRFITLSKWRERQLDNLGL